MADEGLSSYQQLREEAQERGVYEYAKTLKVERMMNEGKERDEISARPQKKDLEAALEDRGGCDTETVCDGEYVADGDNGQLFGGGFDHL